MWKVEVPCKFFIFSLFALKFMQNVSLTTSAGLTPTYSKVSRWGADSSITNENEPRSNGHIWTTNSTKGNKRRLKPEHYSTKLSKFDHGDTDTVPAKGEVQDRFNPAPYFDFAFKDPPRPNRPRPVTTKAKETDIPTFIYGSPLQAQLPSDSYLSPFSSYNPPQSQISNLNSTTDVFNFPPTKEKPPLTVITNQKPKSPSPPATSYGVPKDPLQNTDTYLPPDAVIEDNVYPPLVINTSPNPDDPYLNPPDSIDIPPQPQHPYIPEYNPMKQSAKPSHTPKDPTVISMQMAEGELSPPPVDTPYARFPEYLDHNPYDFHDSHHEVYHEVHATTSHAPTTTEAPRAGAGHYSYYYLGRKLWYIPLYFSVYFIVYVTVLILKSIARHKIQFSHHLDKGRSAREYNILNQTVITAIEESRNKYM